MENVECTFCGGLTPAESHRCYGCGEVITVFSEHPSKVLRDTFKLKAYQGSDPSKASVIFFGRDANYPRDIAADNNFFNILQEYHANGEYFWTTSQNNPDRFHHPFLMDMFRRRENNAGYLYHKRFSNIGLDWTYAQYISFVEIINVPTTGNPRNDPQNELKRLLCSSKQHLAELESQLLSSGKKLVFIPSNAMQLLNNVEGKTDLYQQLYGKRDVSAKALQTVYRHQNKKVYFVKYYHLSARRAPTQSAKLKKMIDKFLNYGAI